VCNCQSGYQRECGTAALGCDSAGGGEDAGVGGFAAVTAEGGCATFNPMP